MSKVTDIRDTKSILARLMATENLTIEHRKVSTASFQLATRTLTLPIWKDMDGDIYDLLTGHEVGHAKHTPAAGWHDAVCENYGANFKSFLNVLEDCRIEKKIKRDYPGLRRSFSNAYKELFDRDFFGIEQNKVDVNSLNLIDRINLYSKVGAHVHVRFNDEEQVYVNRSEQLETWEEVVALAKEVYDFVKEQEKKKKQEQKQAQKKQEQQQEENQDQDQGDQGEEPDGESESSPETTEETSGDDSENQQEQEQQEQSQADESSEEETSDEEQTEAGDEEQAEAGDEDQTASAGETDGDATEDETDSEEDDDGDVEVDSLTDRNFRENEGNLVDSYSTGMFYCTMPTCDLDKAIIPIKTTLEAFEPTVSEALDSWNFNRQNKVSYESLARILAAEFQKNNTKYINLLTKEFEMRKNADQYSRQKVSKSGELDTRRLSQYRFNSDIFKKITTVSKGKNHGMVMFLDMSGSMNTHLKNTVDQLLVLTTFCKKVGVPFEVYGFCDKEVEGYVSEKFIYSDDKVNFKSNNDIEKFHLKSLLSSEMSSSVYKRAVNMLLVWGAVFNSRTPDIMIQTIPNFMFSTSKRNSSKMALGSTPFVETLIASRGVIENFKRKTGAEIINVIHLTDGEGTSGININGGYNEKVIMVDPISKKKVSFNSCYPNCAQAQMTMTKFIRELTGVRHIGFYVTHMGEVKKKARDYCRRSGNNYQKMYNFINENNFFAAEVQGYDSYYFVNSQINTTEETLYINAGMSKSKMASEFMKHQNKKKTSRVVVTQFVKEIAA